jgi:hypothetical protein
MSASDVVAGWLDRERFPIVALMLALSATACLMPAQNDTWWQLRAGEEIWKARRVILVDEFTHTVAGQPWPDHEWLTQVLFFRLNTLGGMPLLTAFCAGAVMLAWGLVATLTPGRGLWRAAAIGAGAALSAGAWSIRPQVLTMALLSATLWILARRRGVWWLPLLFLLWANLHGAVALGGVLLFAALVASFIAHDKFHRTLLAVGALCFMATLMTPLGWSLWLEMPAMIRRVQRYGISEWRGPGLTDPAEILFWLVAVATMAIIAIRRRAVRTADALTLAVSTIVLCLMAMRNARQMAPFFLCAVPTLALLVDRRPFDRGRASEAGGGVRRNALVLAGCAAAAIMVVHQAWRSPWPQLQWKPVPSEMIAALSACEGRLYNRYDEGGYLLWFMKGRKIFMDGRQDPFSEQLVLEHLRVERTGDYRGLFEQYDISCALTPRGSPVDVSLKRDGWIGRHAGEGWTVYSHNPIVKADHHGDEVNGPFPRDEARAVLERR